LFAAPPVAAASAAATASADLEEGGERGWATAAAATARARAPHFSVSLRRGENLAHGGGGKEARANKAARKRFVPGAAAGDDRDEGGRVVCCVEDDLDLGRRRGERRNEKEGVGVGRRVGRKIGPRPRPTPTPAASGLKPRARSWVNARVRGPIAPHPPRRTSSRPASTSAARVEHATRAVRPSLAAAAGSAEYSWQGGSIGERE
jgi:hypothetical protein